MQSLSEELISIEPISVPKAFSENGYTPEVASSRLRDALIDFSKKAGTRMHDPSIALRGELPSIIVPKVELSLDTIASSVRKVLHFGNRRNISGEFTIRGNLLWLRLRVDGKHIYSSLKGLDLESPDDLLAAAAPVIIDKIQPYFTASALYDTDPTQALEKADSIIARLPESDVNVRWSYILRGLYFTDHKDYVRAEEALRKAINLDWNNATAHYDLASALFEQGKVDDAIAEYRLAIKIDPNDADAHINLGTALYKRGKVDDAMAEYRLAIKIDPNEAGAHNNLGNALSQQGKGDDAMAEYRLAIKIDPNEAGAHINLGIALFQQGKVDDAIAEYRLAIKIDPNEAGAHNNLGNALFQQGKVRSMTPSPNIALPSRPIRTKQVRTSI